MVGSTAKLRRASIPSFGDMPDGEILLFYISHLTLIPPLVFEHLSGRGLMSILKCVDLHVSEESTFHNLEYVHGHSEMIRGKPNVSAVLLARPTFEVDEATWLLHLPRVYEKFLSLPKQG